MSVLRHPDWHLFAEQRFRRRKAVSTFRQSFRGEPYIILGDRLTGQHVRLAAQAQELWRRLDGKSSAQEIWDDLIQRPASAPTQAELVEWLLQMVQSGLILSDHELDPRHLTERSQKRRSGIIEQRAASPLAVKIRLFDPDPLVRATWPVVRFLFTRFGAFLVAALLVFSSMQAILNAQALARNADSVLLSQIGLIGLAVAYPIMKGLHELAHCYALFRFGGRVREFGIMLLVFFPVPYVEASEATTLPDKRARMLVGGAGILAELFMASLALLAWLALEPSIERAVLFNFIVLGTVSTLLFNGNPLLKFDAYYVISDWLEMPNLAQRAGDYISDRFLWLICGLRREIETRQGEASILTIYGILSLTYRVLLTLTIALIVSNWFFVFGIMLGVWAIIMGLVWPLVKTARKGARMAKAQNRTSHAGLRLLVFGTALAIAATLIPLPFSAKGSGQIVPTPEAQVVVGSAGRISKTFVEDGQVVEEGDAIALLDAPEMNARLASLEISVTFLTETLALAGLAANDRQRILRELEVARSVRDDILARIEDLNVRVPRDGSLAWTTGQPPLPGAFMNRGDVIGHVIGPSDLDIVLALPTAYSGLQTEAALVEMLLPDGTRLTRPITRQRVVDVGGQVPTHLLVSAGGPVPEQPSNPGHALDTVWLIWADPGMDLADRSGMRFDALISFGSASFAQQVAFHLRRLFLRVVRV